MYQDREGKYREGKYGFQLQANHPVICNLLPILRTNASFLKTMKENFC